MAVLAGLAFSCIKGFSYFLSCVNSPKFSLLYELFRINDDLKKSRSAWIPDFSVTARNICMCDYVFRGPMWNFGVVS